MSWLAHLSSRPVCRGQDQFPESNVTKKLTKEAVYLDKPYSEQQIEGFMKQFRVFY